MVLLPVPLCRGGAGRRSPQESSSTQAPAWGRPPHEHVTAGRIIAVPATVGGNSSLHELVIDLQVRCERQGAGSRPPLPFPAPLPDDTPPPAHVHTRREPRWTSRAAS